MLWDVHFIRMILYIRFYSSSLHGSPNKFCTLVWTCVIRYMRCHMDATGIGYVDMRIHWENQAHYDVYVNAQGSTHVQSTHVQEQH